MLRDTFNIFKIILSIFFPFGYKIQHIVELKTITVDTVIKITILQYYLFFNLG